MALKVRTMKLDDETWERWQAEAKARGMPLTALIVLRMEAGDPVDRAGETAPDKLASAIARIAELEKALAVKPASALAAKSAIASLRYDPKMKAVEPTADGKGLVAAVLPLTGTEFPARPVYLRGQDPAKGKGKR